MVYIELLDRQTARLVERLWNHLVQLQEGVRANVLNRLSHGDVSGAIAEVSRWDIMPYGDETAAEILRDEIISTLGTAYAQSQEDIKTGADYTPAGGGSDEPPQENPPASSGTGETPEETPQTPETVPRVDQRVLDYIQERQDFAENFDRDLANSVREQVLDSVKNGVPEKQLAESINETLQGDGTLHRAETIARTETTKAYNYGQMESFADAGIDAVEFCNMDDGRTTSICHARNGLILARDDDLVAQNTPPLHYNCRSRWSPVPWEILEEMGGKARLAEDREKFLSAPPPMDGFGG